MRLSILVFFISIWSFTLGLAEVTTTPLLFLGNELISKNKLPYVVKYLVEDATRFIAVEPYLYAPAGFRMNWIETFNQPYIYSSAGAFWGRQNIKKYAILQERPEILLSEHIKTLQPLENALLLFTQDKRDPYILDCTPYLFIPYLSKEKANRQEELNEKLLKMAAQRKITVLPVAQIWREVESKNDRIYLYHANDEFPSQIGSYLTACVILEVIFKISCVGCPTTFDIPAMPIPIKFQLPPEQCKLIQQTVHDYFKKQEIAP